MSSEGSVTRWLDQLQLGDSAAIGPLWQRYFHRLVGLARKKLADARGGWLTRRTWRRAPSTVSAATPSGAGSPTWPTATGCGGCWW